MGVPAYLVVGTVEPITSLQKVSTGEYFKAGMFMTVKSAEDSLSTTKMPEQFKFLSIVRILVKFYVCVDRELGDSEMIDKSASDTEYSPPILHGPVESMDQANMLALLVDRSVWKGATTVAMTEEGAARTKRVTPEGDVE